MAEILLVEDGPGDVRLVREALRQDRIAHRLSVVGDGVAALAFLRREDGYTLAPRPDIILLDLNLPRKNGHEVLAAIRADQELRTIPVIVLSTSAHEADIRRCYELGANCYIVKPVELDQFLAVIAAIGWFWLSVATLPDGVSYAYQ